MLRSLPEKRHFTWSDAHINKSLKKPPKKIRFKYNHEVPRLVLPDLSNISEDDDNAIKEKEKYFTDNDSSNKPRINSSFSQAVEIPR